MIAKKKAALAGCPKFVVEMAVLCYFFFFAAFFAFFAMWHLVVKLNCLGSRIQSDGL